MKLKDKRILVTGGVGFLGRPIIDKLRAVGYEAWATRKQEYNLVDMSQAEMCLQEWKPNIVIHCAAYYGGIEINQKYPAKIYYDNLVMGANIIEACQRFGVEKFVGVGTACSYPGYLEGELKEDDLWKGVCHESVRNYGMTKKMMQIQCEAYKKQYGFNGIHLILTNLYGEWDSYNPERSHVVAALIRRFVEATRDKKEEVVVWGTGKPIREFLYVGDAAEAIVRAMEVYDEVEPLNIGTGVGTSIKELVDMINDLTGYSGRIVRDTSKPDGQLKKILDVECMKLVLTWEPPTLIYPGLQRTIDWFVTNYEKAIERW